MDDAPEGEAPDITTTDAHTGIKQTPSNEALMTAQQKETEDPVMTVGKAPAGDDPDPNPSVNDDPLAGCRVAIKLLDASDVPSSASSVSDPDSYLSATAWVGGGGGQEEWRPIRGGAATACPKHTHAAPHAAGSATASTADGPAA